MDNLSELERFQKISEVIGEFNASEDIGEFNAANISKETADEIAANAHLILGQLAAHESVEAHYSELEAEWNQALQDWATESEKNRGIYKTFTELGLISIEAMHDDFKTPDSPEVPTDLLLWRYYRQTPEVTEQEVQPELNRETRKIITATVIDDGEKLQLSSGRVVKIVPGVKAKSRETIREIRLTILRAIAEADGPITDKELHRKLYGGKERTKEDKEFINLLISFRNWLDNNFLYGTKPIIKYEPIRGKGTTFQIRAGLGLRFEQSGSSGVSSYSDTEAATGQSAEELTDSDFSDRDAAILAKWMQLHEEVLTNFGISVPSNELVGKLCVSINNDEIDKRKIKELRRQALQKAVNLINDPDQFKTLFDTLMSSDSPDKDVPLAEFLLLFTSLAGKDNQAEVIDALISAARMLKISVQYPQNMTGGGHFIASVERVTEIS